MIREWVQREQGNQRRRRKRGWEGVEEEGRATISTGGEGGQCAGDTGGDRGGCGGSRPGPGPGPSQAGVDVNRGIVLYCMFRCWCHLWLIKSQLEHDRTEMVGLYFVFLSLS